ncbi:uncharacterized protein FTJAE_935 [Fusarium tjaetaba]|uniref:Uncharacterized protein n=1 Tax=Fusarium tjaetaba TaxID=1567544 RepID=A0A8H5SD72_9HYPO|nr:uncharacterized protein FTJAE_935 [Fusarium tjaetaba]KAF5649498.1 hypothetical protein FTJAE_935 [Fusarium tjaetaba]
MDDDLFAYQVDGIQRKNFRLTRRINNLDQQIGGTGDTTREIKKFVNQLYDSIADLVDICTEYINSDTPHDPNISQKIAFRAWRTFFRPIEALRRIPSCGEFVAARMYLCVGWGFCEAPVKLGFDRNDLARETKPLYEFIADLDDILLEPLKEIWTLSANRERFDWVYTDFDCPSFRATVGALSPQEQKDLGGIRPKEYWYNDPTESTEWVPYTGKMPRWDCGENDYYYCDWTWEGSDGPIDEWLEYKVLTDNDPDRSTWHGIDVFRRSRQFCLDARQKSEEHIGRQQHQAFDEATRDRLPPELRNQILGHIEYRDPFPYLEKLDLVEAYAPFPQVGGSCTQCDTSKVQTTAKRTCPQKAMHVWNMALRRFHTFHKISCETWSLCSHHDCKGHHDDYSWKVDRDPGFTAYLESQAARGNDNFVSLDQVGFGPMNPIKIDPAEDWIRHDKLFRGKGIYSDARDDVLMIGGLGGLKDSMIHGRTLTDGWEGDTDLFYDSKEEGVSDMPTTWPYGRDLSSEKVAKEVMRELHSETDCELCVNVTNVFDLIM